MVNWQGMRKRRLERSLANKSVNLQNSNIFSSNSPYGLLFMAIGIGIYFRLPIEGNSKYTAISILLLLFLSVLSRNKRHLNTVLTASLIIVVGYGLALYRTHESYTPLLEKNFKPFMVEMIVEKIEPLQRNRIRYTGKVLSLSKKLKKQTPKRIRIRTTDQGPRFKYGDLICGKVMLARPKGPMLLEGYDFGQALWFKKIGGTGYNISPIKICSKTNENKTHISSLDLIIAKIRATIGSKLDSKMTDPYRSMARALILGDRGQITPDNLVAMRDAGLGHLLAISGLHMAIFAGTLFILVRSIFALFPIFAQTHPIKKYSAFIALVGGAVYFLISGQSIPTQRAFLMISVIFTAIMIERSALTLRNVAMAAFLILLIRPESLLSPGFQMSFAAVTALIMTYQYNLKYQPIERLAKQTWLKPIYYLGGIWMTSIIASLATAPFAAYHFHKISYMGPVGNMLAIPVFSIFLMPSALLSLIMMPIGLEQLGLFPLHYSIDILLKVAHWTASFHPATITVGAINLSSVLLMTTASFMFFFMLRPYNYTSLIVLALGIYTATIYQKPIIFVGGKADVIAIRGADNQIYSISGRKGAFIINNWLKADGNNLSHSEIRNSPYLLCDDGACAGETKNLKISMVKTIDALEEACQSSDILIIKYTVTRKCKSPKLIITKKDIDQKGTHTIFLDRKKLRIEAANDFRKTRIWSGYQ